MKIKLTKEQMKELSKERRDLRIAETAFLRASKLLDNGRIKLWKKLLKMYPDAEGKKATFDFETEEIEF